MPTYFKSGEWNAICDVCGVQYKSGQLLKRWDGLMVCHKDYETRHPQTLLRVKQEKLSVPFTRKMADTYIDVPFCSLAARTSIPGYAGPGCSIPAVISPTGL